MARFGKTIWSSSATASGKSKAARSAGAADPLLASHVREADEQVGQAPGSGGRGICQRSLRVDPDAGVAAEAGELGGDHGQLTRSFRVRGRHLSCCGEEHLVGDLNRAGVPLDACPQASDVGAEAFVDDVARGRAGQGVGAWVVRPTRR